MKALTTGEMIDRIKIGQRARIVGDDDFIVTKDENGSIVWQDTGNVLVIDGGVIDTKWELEKQFISFDEAIEHLKNEETVNFHHEGVSYEINSINDMEDCNLIYVRWIDLFGGRFYLD